MLPTSARPDSTIFVVFDTSGVHSVNSLLRSWCFFVTSRVDYCCNVVFAGVPKTVTNKLQQVLNVAARMVSGSRMFHRSLTQLIHAELHWLDVPERVKYKLGMITRRCLNATAPQYLAAHCVPVSATASRHHLRSAATHQLVVPSY